MNTVPRRLGKYELQVLLGRGGMAEVWKALDTQLQRYVAIKLLQANLQADPDFVTRFTREAQVVAALRHPNIVQIYDFHISEAAAGDDAGSDAIAYMVMEYIKGSTLAHYIHNTSHKKQIPPFAEIVQLFTPISLALDYAHQQGMIHRDIKPANILLDQNRTTRNPMGEPILSDFGLAKLANAASQTATGAVFGTPLYIAPEQVQNHPVSKQTDLYALGVVLYEIFAGAPPFQGENLSGVMMQHVLNTPTEPHLVNADLPPALSQVLMKSLAKNPADRFASASAMIAAVAEALAIPLPQDLQQALSTNASVNSTNAASMADKTEASDAEVSSAATVRSSSAAFNAAPAAEASADDPTVLAGANGLPVKAEVISGPIRLPNSEPQLQAPDSETHLSVPTKREAGLETSPPPSRPTARKPRGWQVALAAVLVCVLLGSGLGAFFLLSHRATPTPVVAANRVVGQASFASSGHVDMTTNQGNNDEFQINLQNIPAPQSGKSYYAWLLPDKSQTEAAPLLLGKLQVKHGSIHFSYSGDSQHTNLLAITSRFLITEESASTTPIIPSPDLSAWRYYAEIPQTPSPADHYSLLDHLRHLLAIDPTLETLHLHGGLNSWTYRNTQSIQNWAKSASDAWNNKDYSSVHNQVVSILDYLDGEQLVRQDVPAGTPLLADAQIAQVGLLEVKSGQNPPGYLYHIALHLNGVLSAPGSTQYQRTLATQISKGITNVTGWLTKLRQDAVQLARMDDAQLALPSSQALIKNLLTQANNAFQGRKDPSTGQQQIGVTQVYRLVQLLATFEVKPYK